MGDRLSLGGAGPPPAPPLGPLPSAAAHPGGAPPALPLYLHAPPPPPPATATSTGLYPYAAALGDTSPGRRYSCVLPPPPAPPDADAAVHGAYVLLTCAPPPPGNATNASPSKRGRATKNAPPAPPKAESCDATPPPAPPVSNRVALQPPAGAPTATPPMRDTGKDPVRVMGVGCGVSVLVAVAEALFVFDGVRELEGVAVGVGELEGVGEKESKHATAGSPNVPGGHAVPMRNVTLSIRRVPPPPRSVKPAHTHSQRGSA